jgi:hypothetical protein
VIGRGVLGVTKYNAAVAAYDGTIKTAIGTRTSTLHDNFISISNVTVPTPNFRLIKRNESFSEYLGRVTYTYEYGNDSTLGDAPFLKTDIEVGNDYRVPLTRTVLVPGFMEVEQNRGNLTIGHQRVNIGLRGVRGTTITQYLTQAKSLAATYNIGNIDSAQYSFSPTSNQFTLEILWPRFS